MSFNFTNSLICEIVSSATRARATVGYSGATRARNNRARLPHREPGLPYSRRDEKNPIAGGPGIGAQFWSFNFTNSLICGIVSSAEPTVRPPGCNDIAGPRLLGFRTEERSCVGLSATTQRCYAFPLARRIIRDFLQPKQIRPLSFEFSLHKRVGEYLRLFFLTD